MKRIIVLLLLRLPGTLAAQAAEEYAFVVRIGADTFAVENVTRLPGRVDVDLVSGMVGRLRLGVELDAAERVTLVTLEAWRPGASAEGAPGQAGRISFRGDSVAADFTVPAGTPAQRFGSQPGAVPFLNPSFAMLELILRRAAALGGDSAVVPVFMLQGGATSPVVVRRRGADSVTVNFSGAAVELTVDPAGRLRSGRVPTQNLTIERVPGHVRPPTPVPPDYGAPAGAPYAAEHVRIPTPAGHVLAGTLTRPVVSVTVPAVVLVTGSGSQDRDESLALVRGYRPFRELADTLSRRGIAVLRLDDRGYGESTGDAATATSADFAADVRAALAWLRARPDIEGTRLGVVGHSEGGMIAPMVAAADSELAAIVLIAGPARTGRTIIAYQQRYALERLPGIRPEALDSALAAARAQVNEQAARMPWLRYFLDHDPLAVARQVRRTPVLILQGETDRQVTADQAEELAAAFRAGGNRDVTVRVFPGVNHLLLRDADGNPAGYPALEDRSVVPEVRGALADWLAGRLRR